MAGLAVTWIAVVVWLADARDIYLLGFGSQARTRWHPWRSRVCCNQVLLLVWLAAGTPEEVGVAWLARCLRLAALAGLAGLVVTGQAVVAGLIAVARGEQAVSPGLFALC